VQKVKEFTEIRRARREDWSTFCAIKIVKDLWRGFHLYENYDSKPPVRADKNDLGASALRSVGVLMPL